MTQTQQPYDEFISKALLIAEMETLSVPGQVPVLLRKDIARILFRALEELRKRDRAIEIIKSNWKCSCFELWYTGVIGKCQRCKALQQIEEVLK
jgi:hypothetical protein